MKKLFKVALLAACISFTASFVAKAQSKQGYVYFSAIIDVMPEKATLQKTLQDYQKTFADQYQLMQTEYQTKGADYEKNRATMTDAVRAVKESELTDIQGRIQKFSADAQQKMEAKQSELAKPLFDKVKLAVNAVAKEKGYGFVLDATSQILVVAPDADDLTPAVKLKLGIK
ncbi:periplasmic chaperone for outer membrane proteins Skp [Mucilaginibacter gracilis]|uniref:Periplasmic chaperone for outer membrane proteins Skp n=1 Tax=Mucilaginibacter gracilis TaxID=423350 RepID=A0A495J0S6_9SPHI|nr:OmpH family outer membrane protein [Mucilaginibacter gracilis]RKR82560.1 periplasmic chaperone for outer membrane proteins Skp [Mucilaginibacter gracilis]